MNSIEEKKPTNVFDFNVKTFNNNGNTTTKQSVRESNSEHNDDVLEFQSINNLNVRKSAKKVLAKKYSLTKTSLSLLESLGIYYTKSRYKSLNQNQELFNKCVNEGLYHVTNIENIDRILNSGEIYASSKFTSYSKTNKAFFTAGIPSFENACAFSIYKDKIVALKIKETPENLLNPKFKNRYLTDQAITYDNNFDIKNKNVEVVYLGLTLENGDLVYKNMGKEQWINYKPEFKNTIQNNLNLKFANKLKEYSIALTTEHDLFFNAIKNRIKKNISKVRINNSIKTDNIEFTTGNDLNINTFKEVDINNLKNEITSEINTKTNAFTVYLLEAKYIKTMGREVSNNPKENDDLFPTNWNFDINYDSKIEMLTDAIENKCLIIETKYYNNSVQITTPGMRR